MFKKFLATLLLSVFLIPSAFAATANHTLEEIAAFLGMTTEELQVELGTGATLQEIAEEMGVNKEDLRNFLNAGPNSIFSQLLLDADFVQGLADLLNMSSEQLLDELAAGKTPNQLAEQQGVQMVIIKGYLKEAVAAYKVAHPTERRLPDGKNR